MDIMTVNKVVPKLRFKEFSENWIQSAFSEISKEFSYGTGSAATKYDGENKYLRITDIDDETRMFKPNPLTSPNCIIQDKYKLKEDDIVFARTGASVGKSYLYNNCDGNLIYAGFLIKMSVNSADSSFIFYETLREKYYKWVSVYSVRSGQPGLNAEELKSYKLYLPNLIEQKKISSFLGALDEKLQQLTKKKELLEDYKKGIMQKIFKGDWQEKKLSDFCTFFSGGTPSSSNREYYLGDIPFIGSGDIHDSKVFKYISKEALNNSSAKLVKKGDLLYALYGATSGDSAISKIEGAINQAILCLRTNECIEYLNYLLVLNKGKIIRKYLQGGQGNLSANIIKKLKFKIPEIEEQKKIADFLTAIDKKIEIVSHQLEKNKEFKKGLLQQMFV